MENQGLTVFLDPDGIEAAVRALAARINADYGHRPAAVVGVLKGAFVFLADLVRHLELPCEVDFVHVESYGSETVGTEVTLRPGGPADLSGKRVLLVEDIVDTGRTARFLIEHMLALGAAGCDLCTLLDKPSRRQVPVDVAYRGLTVPNRFFVGYGMDLDGRYRNLPGLHCLEPGLP